jgi:hypothetical protein
MSLIFSTIQLFFKSRLNEIETIIKNPVKSQEEVLKKLINTAKNTEWGKKHNFSSISNVSQFQKNVPISSYEDLFPFIEKMMAGEKDVLWPGLTSWFAKSSGTTNARSKFIPVSKESLEDCHLKAGKDEVILYLKNNSKTKIFDGKSLCVGGSLGQIKSGPEIFCGDISAIMMKNLSFLGEYLRTPSLETALMADYEKKVEKLAEEASKENVVSIVGVPTWISLLIKKVIEKKQAKNIFEVWPNLEVFFHGAVSFAPYQKLFAELLPSPNMFYVEAYNASEGFFAIQDDLNRKGEMLLMPDYGVFYEFIPLSEFFSDKPRVLTMAEVETGKNYVLVISTNAGLWRYVIGDTVMFTTLSPHRIKITGRTKHFINVFGEEVAVHNADTAISEACAHTGALLAEYTVAPIFMENGKGGAHEWLVEFVKEPSTKEEFNRILDNTLRKINSDYDAKRFKDIALGPPVVRFVASGTFYKWMESRGKVGGQNKVPRLSNTREYLESILKLAD